MLILNPLFTAHMVFAANRPVRIFGTGNGTGTVDFAGHQYTVTASDNCWNLELPPMEYGGPYTLTVSSKDQTLILDDIYIGEVYLLAGQSNMQFKLWESNTPPDLWHSNEKLRLFSTRRLEEGDRYTPEDGWLCCTKENVGDWSAIGYLAGDLLSRKKDIAVGLITCYQGASVIEGWVPKNTFSNAGIALPDSGKFYDHFEPTYTIWNSDGALYEFALGQVLPFSLTCVLWYQGESDCSVEEGAIYDQELCLLIDSWRKGFSLPSLPFLVIQIADNLEPTRPGWKLIQQAQLKVPSLRENVRTVICADICENYEIHPKTKDKLAERIVDTLLDANY